MSEIRSTTTIEEIDVPSREPLVSLTQVLSSIGWVTYQGTKLAVKGAIIGSVLACKGGVALANTVKEKQKRSISLPEIGKIIASSKNAREAITALASTPGLELPLHEAKAISARLELLASKNDKKGVEAAARELVLGKQNRLYAQMLPLVAEACQAIGFMPQTIDSKRGIIVVRGDGRQSAVLEIAKSKDGGVRLHADSDGFGESGACVSAFHEPLARELRARGVHFEIAERRRKQSRPVFDRNRGCQSLHARCG